MNHFLSPYPMEVAQMPTDQREHELEHRPSVQTKSESSDTTRAFVEIDDPPSYPCPQYEGWAGFPQLPGSMMPFQHSIDYGAPWIDTGLGADESKASPLSRASGTEASTSACYISPFNSVPHSKRNSYRDPIADWNIPPQAVFTTPSSFYEQDSNYCLHDTSRHSMNVSESMMRPVRMGPTPSRSVSLSPHQSPSQSVDGISPTATNAVGDDLNSPGPSIGDNTSEEDPITEPPYSALIYDSLKDAPERKRTLQQIYVWFKANTNKDKDPNSKGWQNSIRHNLSMNAGFEAIKGENENSRPVNFWRLTDEAYKNGIQSTTRYRKANHRKGNNSSDPTATRERRRSGSKGGKAAKNAAKMRNSPQYEQRREKKYDHQNPMLHSHLPPTQPHRQIARSIIRSPPSSTLPPPYDMGLGPAHSGLPSVNSSHTYRSTNVISCTSPPPGQNPVFCGPGGLPDSPGFSMGQLGYYNRPTLGSNHGFHASPENTADLQYV